MIEFVEAFRLAFNLIITLDANILEIVLLSLKVSLVALIVACLIGFSLGSILAVSKFYGRGIVLIIINSFMALPPVVVGLAVYMLLSKSGMFGWMNILYTPSAMIIAQSIIITPIVLALSRQVIEDLNNEYSEFLNDKESFIKAHLTLPIAKPEYRKNNNSINLSKSTKVSKKITQKQNIKNNNITENIKSVSNTHSKPKFIQDRWDIVLKFRKEFQNK